MDVGVLTHADLKHSARINAFMSHLAEGSRHARHLFEHDSPDDAPT